MKLKSYTRACNMAKWGATFKAKSGRIPKDSGGVKINEVAEKIVDDVAVSMHEHAVGGILMTRRDWEPLHPMTVAMKGFDKPLIEKGDLLRSIEMDRDGLVAYVGVMTKTGSRGQDLGLVASVMENGATIPVSEKMRGWFLHQGFPLKASTVAIRIPARPFLAPAADETEEDLDTIVGKHADELVEAFFSG